MKCLILKQSLLAKNEEETKRPLDTTFQMTYYELKKEKNVVKEVKHLGWFVNFEYISQLEALLQAHEKLTLEYRTDLHDGELPLRVCTIEDIKIEKKWGWHK